MVGGKLAVPELGGWLPDSNGSADFLQALDSVKQAMPGLGLPKQFGFKT